MTDTTQQWKQISRAYEILERKFQLRHQSSLTLGDRLNRAFMVLQYQFLPHYFGVPPRWRVRLRKLDKSRTLPDFACVGAIKSGTSDLSTYLFQHPCIMLPLAKEIWSYSPGRWRLYYPTQRERARVEREHGQALNGFFSPWMHNLDLMNAFKTARPHAKIIIMVRNPIDRAYSHWKWDLFLGGKSIFKIPYYESFARYINLAIDLYPDTPMPSRCTFPLLQTGIYHKSVALWFERFGRENVYILRAEDFFTDTVEAVCSVQEFLGLRRVPPQLMGVVNQNPMKAPPMDEATRERLREFYRPKNEQFYSLIGRDMDWDR